MDNNIVKSEAPEPSRHQRKCSVCRHPERDAIEEAFLHWQSPNEIAIQHDLSDEASIYRHAHATGLFARRDCNLRFALANFIERVNEIQVVTPGAIVRAVRAYTRISKTGEWVEPPRQIIVTHVQAAEVPACDPDITQITTPKALPPRLKRLGNPTARLGGAVGGGEPKLNANRKSGLLANVAYH
jgi:hypothetical protein